MSIKVRFEEGVFRPLEPVEGLQEGGEYEISLEDLDTLAMLGESFDFLEDEDDIYSLNDVVERY